MYASGEIKVIYYIIRLTEIKNELCKAKGKHCRDIISKRPSAKKQNFVYLQFILLLNYYLIEIVSKLERS